MQRIPQHSTPAEVSFITAGWIKREFHEVRQFLIGLVLEDRDADSLLVELEELRGQIAVRRRTAKPADNVPTDARG
jgi:hypothetical protein